MSQFIEDEPKAPHAFIQWKNTDVCFDFWCECGAQGHFDGYFAYVVKCPECERLWEMPCYLIPRPSKREHPVVTLEVIGEDGDATGSST